MFCALFFRLLDLVPLRPNGLHRFCSLVAEQPEIEGSCNLVPHPGDISTPSSGRTKIVAEFSSDFYIEETAVRAAYSPPHLWNAPEIARHRAGYIIRDTRSIQSMQAIDEQLMFVHCRDSSMRRLSSRSTSSSVIPGFWWRIPSRVTLHASSCKFSAIWSRCSPDM